METELSWNGPRLPGDAFDIYVSQRGDRSALVIHLKRVCPALPPSRLPEDRAGTPEEWLRHAIHFGICWRMCCGDVDAGLTHSELDWLNTGVCDEHGRTEEPACTDAYWVAGRTRPRRKD